MSEREVHALLHEVWLRVHNRRFDDLVPDSTYSGVMAAEQEIHEIAAQRGIDWHALRRPTTPEPSQQPGVSPGEE